MDQFLVVFIKNRKYRVFSTATVWRITESGVLVVEDELQNLLHAFTVGEWRSVQRMELDEFSNFLSTTEYDTLDNFIQNNPDLAAFITEPESVTEMAVSSVQYHEDPPSKKKKSKHKEV